MLNLLVTLPLQFACHLVGPGNFSHGNFTIVESMPVLDEPPASPEGYIAFPDVGVAYKYYYATDVTWNEARKRCMVDGATLAVLDSFKKIRYALSVKRNDTAPHVGIHRTYDGIEWTSVKTGLPLSSIPWAPEPALTTANWNCAALYPDGRGLAARKCSSGKPVDFIPWRPDSGTRTGSCIVNHADKLGVSRWNCNNPEPVVCEIPIFPESNCHRDP